MSDYIKQNSSAVPISINTDNMSAVWEQYKRLAYHVAGPYFRAYPSMKEDIRQECYLAVYEAVSHYKPDSASFSTCLPFYVRLVVGRYCRRNSSTFSFPEHIFRKQKKVSDARTMLRNAGIEETEEKILSLSGLTAEQYRAVSSAESAINASSLSDPVPGSHDLVVSDVIPDLQNNIDDAFEKLAVADLHHNLNTLLQKLPPDDRTIVCRYYYEGKTFSEIGKEYGLSVNSIHVRIEKALQIMQRSAKRSHAFDEYLDDCTYTIASHGGLNTYLHSWTSSTEKAAFRRIELSDNFRKEHFPSEKRRQSGTKSC